MVCIHFCIPEAHFHILPYVFRIREQYCTFLTVVVNILYILLSFAKLKLLMVKLLPRPRELPHHGTSFSLTEGN